MEDPSVDGLTILEGQSWKISNALRMCCTEKADVGGGWASNVMCSTSMSMRWCRGTWISWGARLARGVEQQKRGTAEAWKKVQPPERLAWNSRSSHALLLCQPAGPRTEDNTALHSHECGKVNSPHGSPVVCPAWPQQDFCLQQAAHRNYQSSVFTTVISLDSKTDSSWMK